MSRLESLYSKADLPIPILAAHGQHLTYLHIYSERTSLYPAASSSLLPCLHELCPRLAHLVVPSVAAYRAIALAPTARAPLLKKVRMVMGSPTCDTFPLHFRPARPPGSDRALEDSSVALLLAAIVAAGTDDLLGTGLSVARVVEGGTRSQDGARTGVRLRQARRHLADVPCADDEWYDGDGADWLVSTTSGIAEWCTEGLVRQHSWAVILDERCKGTLPPLGFWDSTVPDDDATDSKGEYEYESRPTSPVSSQSDMVDEVGGRDDGGKMGEGRSEDGGGSESDMERGVVRAEAGDAPYPNKAQFVDDPLDSSRGQYSRETILERFAQSQLGDFLLE